MEHAFVDGNAVALIVGDLSCRAVEVVDERR